MDVPQLMKVLSNEVNLQILSILKSGSFNPRELARILQRDETDVSRRLKMLERVGLVEGKWMRVRNKNIRIYSLKVGEVKISFEPGGIIIKTSKDRSYEISLLESKMPKVEAFFGRKAEISTLSSSKKPVIVIYGIAGIGKTALAAKVFEDAFWYQMSEVDSFDYFVWQIGLFLNTFDYSLLLEYLRSGGREERDLFELILEGIENTKAKIVIDDVHKCSDERILRLLSFLALRIRDGKLVLISREKLRLGADENILYFHLRGLSLKDAYTLLRAKGLNLDISDFVEIYNLTKGHPLALTLFAGAYKENQKVRTDNFFDFLFSEVYQQLSPDEKLMVQVISLFDDPLEYDAIKTLYGRKNSFVVLYSLLNKGIIEKRGEIYFLHDLLKGFAKEVREIDEREYYLRYLNYLLKKKTAKNFLTAFRYATKLGDEKIIKDLTELRLRKFKRVVQDFPDAYMRILIQIKGNPYAKKELGHIYFQRGFFEKALKLWLEVKDDLDGIHRADVISSLADVCMELNDFKEAEKYLKELESIAKNSDDLEIKFWYYVELTKFYFYTERSDDALRSAFKELEVIRKMEPYPELESLALLHVGDIYIAMKKLENAVQYYLQALEIAKAYNLTFMGHISYMELMKAYYSLGDYKTAVEYSGKAVEYFLKVRNYRRAIDTLAYRCVSYIGLKDLDEAEKDAEEMIRIAQSTNYPLGWAGYIFLGAIKELKGESGKEYFELGKEKLKDYSWLYDAVLEELGKVFNVSKITAKS
ncbi:NB-ARC domain-containing protein [Thermococcus sp. SY098]|uniref:NB-ARC domain-containing protein n=1 Tax=Thermococcus sp. SY098 TaxID=3111325 RepID=UPI002D781628|nr:NB-ARC domain-containing protein [Thermococcus sp. SY098]WRS51664.1 NB-ARC domain-containing protein [Thermococcus sp. SY098]